MTVRWVDTNKGTFDYLIRSRLVARDFKGDDKDRDDLFAETPPLEAIRLLLSRAATRRVDGQQRKLLFIAARKAHLNPRCEDDVYIQLPEECGESRDVCGKLVYWLYGFRKAASAWDKHYGDLLEAVGFVRGVSCGVAFYHPSRDLSLAVHGDDFTFCGLEEDLKWIQDKMANWFEIKVRGLLGPDPEDLKEITILGRIVRWMDDGIHYQADPKHRKIMLESLGMNEGTRVFKSNGDKEVSSQGEDDLLLEKDKAKSFRGLAARLNFMSLDCPDLQFPIKDCSR